MLKITRNDISVADKMLWKVDAWKKGKDVKLTVLNPDKKATNERMIRVKALDYWGSPNPKKKNET